VYVLKMHHVCTVRTWPGEGKRAKGNYIFTATLVSGQYVALSQRERERERDLLEIGKYAGI